MIFIKNKLIIVIVLSSILAATLSLGIDSWLYLILLAVVIGLVIGFLGYIITKGENE